MVEHTKAILSMVFKMVMASINGLMEVYIEATLKMEKDKVMVSFIMLEIKVQLRDTGKMVYSVAMGNI